MRYSDENTPTNKGHPMFHSYYDSPIGPLLLTGNGTALTGLYLAEHVRIATPLGTRDDSAFAEPVRQLGEYFAGGRRAFQLTIAPAGTPFQLRVWRLLEGIGYGERRSYGELAAELGNPNAARAVGLANSRNPISIIVPCHRVVGSKGALTGYAGGLTNKQWLLEFETRLLAGRAAAAS
jgi:methylated-DNA-[protein]-cysteine S-methyltransferase